MRPSVPPGRLGRVHPTVALIGGSPCSREQSRVASTDPEVSDATREARSEIEKPRAQAHGRGVRIKLHEVPRACSGRTWLRATRLNGAEVEARASRHCRYCSYAQACCRWCRCSSLASPAYTWCRRSSLPSRACRWCGRSTPPRRGRTGHRCSSRPASPWPLAWPLRLHVVVVAVWAAASVPHRSRTSA
jgi:hypothetical protein